MIAAFLAAAALAAATLPDKPAATIDLATREGVEMTKGQWEFAPTRVIDAEFRAAGPEGQPTGGPVATQTLAPPTEWEWISPESLGQRRGNGRLSFGWYRISVTVPARVGSYDTAGSTVTFETSVDDYAEVWVDGELSRYAGQNGGSVIAGWNAGNRVITARNVRPGQKIQIAVFAANGPLSNPPTNFIYMRYARLAFHPGDGGPVAVPPSEVNVEVIRKSPAMDRIVGHNPKLYKLADGFDFTEGPVWVRDGGYLLFSDPNANTIYKYTEDDVLSVFRHPSGYSGADIAEYKQPGANGNTLDPQGRLTTNEHGNRRVTRTERDGRMTVLADRFEGKRLNSPNDLVYRSDGTLFFSDPFFGLPKLGDDPRRELPFTGVFALRGGKLSLIVRDLTGPNGLAFSPDEKYLYVGNWDDNKKVVMRYRIAEDGSATDAKLFFDMTSTPGEDAIDGIKVDQAGNVYVSGPGGLWVLSPEGEHLGTILTPKHAHNFTWGGKDGKTLYLCARSALYRMPLNIAGVRP